MSAGVIEVQLREPDGGVLVLTCQVVLISAIVPKVIEYREELYAFDHPIWSGDRADGPSSFVYHRCVPVHVGEIAPKKARAKK